MRNLILVLLFIVGLSAVSFADTTALPSTENKSPYIKDEYTYKPTSCTTTCEEVKDGYFTRVANNNLEKGLITCNIYSERNPLKVLETRVVFNEFCKKEYTFTVNKNRDKPETLRLDEQLKVLETKYFQNFIGTGDVQFLTAPEYLVAILTADADVINIKETIESNQIILNEEYSIFPNQNILYEKNYVQKLYDFFTEINPFEDKNTVITPDKWDVELTSSTSQLISTIGVFWLDFLTESNYLYQETNFLLVVLLVPFSVIILAGESYTHKLSTGQSGASGNWVGGGIVSALVCLGMFITHESSATNEKDIFGQEKRLEQSFYQNSSSNLISEGVKIANSFNASFNKVYINQMARNASVSPNLTQDERIQKLEHYNKLIGVYNAQLESCSTVYNTETLRNVVSNVYDMPLTYPPNESYGSISFYTHLKNPYDVIKSNLLSVDYCYEMSRQKNLYAIKTKNLSKEIANSQKAYDNGMEERVLNIAEVAYKNTVEMGFLSALTTSAMNATLSNLGEYQHYSDDLDTKRDYIKNETQKSIKTYSDVDVSDFVESDVVSLLPKTLSYFAMPFFPDIYNSVKDLSTLGAETVTKNKSSYLNLMANFVIKITKINPLFSSLLEVGKQGVILALSVWIYEYFLQILVPFAILSAGLLVVLFWMAEVVIYYLVIPFMFAYAMLKGQGQAVSKFLARGLIIATRPTLLVFSIIVAILLHSLYESISVFIITKNFSAIFGLNELGLVYTFTGLIQQGFYEVGLKLIVPFIMFFIILTGSTIFLKQFGYSDEAQFSEQLQNSLESRGGKYSLPV